MQLHTHVISAGWLAAPNSQNVELSSKNTWRAPVPAENTFMPGSLALKEKPAHVNGHPIYFYQVATPIYLLLIIKHNELLYSIVYYNIV